MRGQIDGVIKMVEEDKYCIDIMTQLLAVQGSLKGIGSLLLESHLNTCGTEKLASKNPKEKEQFIQELVRSFQLANR